MEQLNAFIASLKPRLELQLVLVVSSFLGLAKPESGVQGGQGFFWSAELFYYLSILTAVEIPLLVYLAYHCKSPYLMSGNCCGTKVCCLLETPVH